MMRDRVVIYIVLMYILCLKLAWGERAARSARKGTAWERVRVSLGVGSPAPTQGKGTEYDRVMGGNGQGRGVVRSGA